MFSISMLPERYIIQKNWFNVFEIFWIQLQKIVPTCEKSYYFLNFLFVWRENHFVCTRKHQNNNETCENSNWCIFSLFTSNTNTIPKTVSVLFSILIFYLLPRISSFMQWCALPNQVTNYVKVCLGLPWCRNSTCRNTGSKINIPIYIHPYPCRRYHLTKVLWNTCIGKYTF